MATDKQPEILIDATPTKLVENFHAHILKAKPPLDILSRMMANIVAMNMFVRQGAVESADLVEEITRVAEILGIKGHVYEAPDDDKPN